MYTVTYYCDLCKKELKEAPLIDVGIYYRYKRQKTEWEETEEICNECLLSLGLTIKEDIDFLGETVFKIVRSPEIFKESNENKFQNFFKKILNRNKKEK